MSWRPRLRTILLGVNVLILLLPVGGIAILRLYENDLIRRTESELIVQGAIVREFYGRAYFEEWHRGEHASEPPGVPVPAAAPLATPLEGGDLTPILPVLDISEDAVRPPAPAAIPHPGGPLPVAAAAGRRVGEQIEAAARTTLAGIRIVDTQGVVVATTGGE
ncbi:MAG: histidine kinase, partial [Acidobacteriota bacterium]|nr:histidine kinase [Acidobacteriota bacterium]